MHRHGALCRAPRITAVARNTKTKKKIAGGHGSAWGGPQSRPQPANPIEGGFLNHGFKPHCAAAARHCDAFSPLLPLGPRYAPPPPEPPPMARTPLPLGGEGRFLSMAKAAVNHGAGCPCDHAVMT